MDIMKKLVQITLLFVSTWAFSQEKTLPVDSLYALAVADLPAFAHYVTRDAKSDFEKASFVIDWFARYFDWTATDYQRRTVRDILERKGGNCNELAQVSKACMETLGLKMRRIREINLHVLTERRQKDAEERVKETGVRASVFGKQHNDHVWLEIFDNATGEWFPADPSLGVAGKRAWLAARYSFGKRYSLDPSSEDMIAPFAVFAEGDDPWIDRTQYYAVEGFNDLYYGQLGKLPAWDRWTALISRLDGKALAAFMGKENLHESLPLIAELSDTYETLKKQFLATDLGKIHQNIDAFSKNLVAGEYDKVVGAYTDDAKIFPDRMEILQGAKAIAGYWIPPPERKSRTIHHRIMPEEIRIIGEEAYDWGYYEGKTRTADGAEAPWRGKYVIVWRKMPDGDWKIYLDIWNRT